MSGGTCITHSTPSQNKAAWPPKAIAVPLNDTAMDVVRTICATLIMKDLLRIVGK